MHTKRKIQNDIKEDFFGFMKYGFPSFSNNFGNNHISYEYNT
jgi:hypothetical protein